MSSLKRKVEAKFSMPPEKSNHVRTNIEIEKKASRYIYSAEGITVNYIEINLQNS